MTESLKNKKASKIIEFQKNNTKFILCDCRSEILVIDYDEEIGMADLAIYEHNISYRHKMSFWQKMRYIYRVLVNNKPYADQIMINKSQIKEIADFLYGCI